MRGRYLMIAAGFMLTAMCLARAEQDQDKTAPGVLNFTMKSLDGQEVNLARYQGKVVLIVNTASRCGYTPQYNELQQLYEKYRDQGLVVLGFPSNDFKNQEPGSDQEIAQFCREKYGVTFDMFSKVVVSGPDKAPLFAYLTDEKTDPQFPGEIKWNFEKFLISRQGQIVGRYRSAVKPTDEQVVSAIEAELAR